MARGLGAGTWADHTCPLPPTRVRLMLQRGKKGGAALGTERNG
jgi:hypothetical protein